MPKPRRPGRPGRPRSRSSENLDRPRALYVYMEDAALKEVESLAELLGKELGRFVSVSALVRAVIGYGVDHVTAVRARLQRDLR